MERIRRIRSLVSVPLSLHGGSSLPVEVVRAAIEAGIAKVNYGTRLKRLRLDGLREALSDPPPSAYVQRHIGSRGAGDIHAPGLRRVAEQIGDLIRVYGTSGMAD